MRPNNVLKHANLSCDGADAVLLRVRSGLPSVAVVPHMADAFDALHDRLLATSEAHHLAVNSLGFGGGALPSLQQRLIVSRSAPDLFAKNGRPPFKPRKHVRPPQLEPIASPPPTKSSPGRALLRKASMAAAFASPGKSAGGALPEKKYFPPLSSSSSPTPSAHSPPSLTTSRPPPDDSYEKDRAELASHRSGLFKFPQQYTYGLLNFDDETVAATLHVDQEARLKPSLLVKHDMQALSFRDVHRADILSRIDPLHPEEVTAATPSHHHTTTPPHHHTTTPSHHYHSVMQHTT